MRGVYGVTASNGKTVILTVSLMPRGLNEPIKTSEDSPSFLNSVDTVEVIKGRVHVEVAEPHAPDKAIACDIPYSNKAPLTVTKATLIEMADAALNIVEV